jgi:hypothetical protein
MECCDGLVKQKLGKRGLLYLPKRKVSNKLSWKIHHITGAFYNHKMNRVVEYESLGERLFYYFLELDAATFRYYVQPIEIEIPIRDKLGEMANFIHVPDALVFRQDYIPLLFQIKHSPDQVSDLFKRCNKFCEKYAEKNNWEYHIIYPKSMPKSLSRNIRLLNNFIKPRKYYENWRDR